MFKKLWRRTQRKITVTFQNILIQKMNIPIFYRLRIP